MLLIGMSSRLESRLLSSAQGEEGWTPKGKSYLSGRILKMKIEELREIFSENGLYAVRVENGKVVYTTLIPGDHVILSIEAFIEYLERLGFKVVRE